MKILFFSDEYVFKTLPEPTSVPVKPSWTMWPWYIQLAFAGGALLLAAAVTVAVVLLVKHGKKKSAPTAEEAGPHDA